MVELRTARTHPGAKGGVLSRVLQVLSRLLAWLAFSLLLSIVLEWLGMVYWWPEAGLAHSAAMLEYEIALVESELDRSLLVGEPQALVLNARDRARALLERTGVAGFVHWAATSPDPGSRSWPARVHRVVHAVSHFLLAALQVIQLFAVRLAILTLAIPAFVLLGAVGLIDGLVARDLRRRGAGRESSFIYHHARAAIPLLLVLPFITYLALPVSLHPGWIVLPAAGLTGLAVTLAARSFKKYL